MILSLVLASSLALAGGPMAPRTVANPYIANSEIAMVMPPNGCGPEVNCLPVANIGGNYLIVENGNVPGPVRIVDGDGYTTGIYLNSMPTVIGWTVDVTTGEQIRVLDGEFVSAMEPCMRNGFWPTGYLKVGAAKSLNMGATSVVFYAEPGPDTVALDARTGAVIKYRPGRGEIVGQVAPFQAVLRTATGTVDYAWRVPLGNGRCQS